MKPAKREHMPPRRPSWQQHVHVGGQSLFLGVGEYEDGRLGEVFIDVARAGSGLRAVLHVLAIAISLGVQHGVPLGKYLSAMRGVDFEPSGPVIGSTNVAKAESILDYVAKELAAAYPEKEGS